MQQISHFLTLSLALSLLAACGVDKDTSDANASGTSDASDTAATSTSAGEQTIGMSTVPTTSGGASSANTSASDTASDTASASSTDGTTDMTGSTSDTGGPVETTGDPDLMKVCQDRCDKSAVCSLPTSPGCVDECVGGFSDLAALCQDATLDLFECINTVSCEEFVNFIENDKPGVCMEFYLTHVYRCGDECVASIEADIDPTKCIYKANCPDAISREMICAGDTCNCFEGDKEVGTCPADGVCMEFSFDEYAIKAEACCEFSEPA